jgi:hypothetical protein
MTTPDHLFLKSYYKSHKGLSSLTCRCLVRVQVRIIWPVLATLFCMLFHIFTWPLLRRHNEYRTHILCIGNAMHNHCATAALCLLHYTFGLLFMPKCCHLRATAHFRSTLCKCHSFSYLTTFVK